MTMPVQHPSLRLTQDAAPNIHRIDTPLGNRYASLYLVEGESSLLLYDTGVDGTIPADLPPVLAHLGRGADEVSAVVVSHCDVDHFGGVADAREQFPNARLMSGAADRSLIEDFPTYLSERARGFLHGYGWDEDPAVLEWVTAVTRTTSLDGIVSDGEAFDLGGGVVAVARAVPGHSHGHVAIDVPSADAVMVGDAVLGMSVDSTEGEPLFPPTYRFVDEYESTIQLLQDLGRATLLTAHYPTFRGEAAAAFLDRSAEFVQSLEGLVVSALEAAPDGLTLAELLGVVNPAAGAWPVHGTEGALAFPVVGHLERLQAAHRLRQVALRDGVPVWRLA